MSDIGAAQSDISAAQSDIGPNRASSAAPGCAVRFTRFRVRLAETEGVAADPASRPIRRRAGCGCWLVPELKSQAEI
jgi:hypothetical protein